MNIADYVPGILKIFQLLCYVVLIFYVLQVVLFIFRGKTSNDPHRLREALAMAYTVVAVYYIFHSTGAIHPFVSNVIDAGSLIGRGTPASMAPILVLCAGLVCVAFICNFSRSLWMLKSLDHAIFEPVPEWENLSEQTSKRLLEFSTRTVAALLFIRLEFELKHLAGSDKNVSGIYFTQAGWYGILLYTCLLVWWVSGRWIAGKDMPKIPLLLYIAGLANSAFIYNFASKISNEDKAQWLMVLLLGAGFLALLMLAVIVDDILKWFGIDIQEWWKGKKQPMMGEQMPPASEPTGH